MTAKLLPSVIAGAGKPIVDNCMGGYNSSIFAYGQTGAGKTYTMQGPLSAALQDDNPQVRGCLLRSKPARLHTRQPCSSVASDWARVQGVTYKQPVNSLCVCFALCVAVACRGAWHPVSSSTSSRRLTRPRMRT